jgi:MFS family permease
LKEDQTGVEVEEAAGWIDVALADYDARRASLLSYLQAAQNTLALGATAVGILIAGALNVWNERLLASITFLVAIPLVCVLVIVQWSGQLILVVQIGVYLENLEKALREARNKAPHPVMTWQKTLREWRVGEKWWIPDFRWHASAAIVIFLLLAVGSIGLGAYRGFSGHEAGVITLVVIEGILLVIVVVCVVWELATGPKRFREQYAEASASKVGAGRYE